MEVCTNCILNGNCTDNEFIENSNCQKKNDFYKEVGLIDFSLQEKFNLQEINKKQLVEDIEREEKELLIEDFHKSEMYFDYNQFDDFDY